MNFKDLDFDNMSLNSLGDFVKAAQEKVSKDLGSMSKEDRKKVDDIVKGIDSLNVDELQKKSVEIKNELDAS